MTVYLDGGPAFPCDDHYNKSGDFHQTGMSLRDWFAALAPEPPQDYMDMQYRLDAGRNPYNEGHKPRRRDGLEIRAQYRFAYADAMLAARQGGAA